MVSKRDRLDGLFNGTRCRRCGRKLTNPKSVDRQIGPECWKILGHQDNYKLPLHKGQVRCKKCGLPIQNLKAHILWREKFSNNCTVFCCGCCPEKLLRCSMLQLRAKLQEQEDLQQPLLEAFV